ncbi:Flp family type IVb pilin [Rothia sp. ARF10]|nr:Flp family type IVb pilin [Rothia sp. ARF10]
MSQAFNKLHRLLLQDRGATMVEYGLMVALVAAVVLVAVGPFGLAVSGLFTGVPSSL